MTYTKLPSEHLTEPRMLGLSDRAFRLYVNGLVYSNAILSDGFVPRGAVSMLAPATSESLLRTAIRELQSARLWLPKPPKGYYIVDFTKHQLTKAQLEERRDQKRVAANTRWHPGEAMNEAGAHASAMQAHSESNGNGHASAMPVPRTPYSVSRKEPKSRSAEEQIEQDARLERVRRA